MPRADEPLHVERGIRDQGPKRRLHRLQHRKYREIRELFGRRGLHRHRRPGRRRLKADAEEHDFLIRVLFRELHRVDRRVDDRDAAAFRPHLPEILPADAPGHADHVAVGRDDDVRPGGQSKDLVDEPRRCHADRAAGPREKMDVVRQHPL